MTLCCGPMKVFRTLGSAFTASSARKVMSTARALNFGGDPLLRPQFAHMVCCCAGKKGFWIYVPTNARLLRPQLTDWLADAAVATFNFAVDTGDEKPGLPKALAPIRSYFNDLVKKQFQHGYSLLQHQHLPQQLGRCPALGPDRARSRHRDRLPHKRITHDGPTRLQPNGEQCDIHYARGLEQGG